MEVQASERLQDFLSGPARFRWMVLAGSGGVGKSRLALELYLSQRGLWHTGFLDRQSKDPPNWPLWQPLQPTLIVIDYAASEQERVGNILKSLSGRGDDGTQRLAQPVRVLLVERTAKGDWRDRMLGLGTEGQRATDAHVGADLTLAAVPPRPIIEAVLAARQRPLALAAAALEALIQIDGEQRPLFAVLVAEQAARGADLGTLTFGGLLDDVVNRWRTKFWEQFGAEDKEQRLLAAATMCGGLDVQALATFERGLFPDWDLDKHPRTFLAITGANAVERVAALQPDIVGEHFALQMLAAINPAAGT